MELNKPPGAIVEENQVLRNLIEASPMPIGLYVGREMRIRIVNEAILKAWGKDGSVMGKTFSEALPELEGQPFFQLLDDVYTTGTAYHATEDRVDLIVDGRLQTFYFKFSYNPVRNEQGEVYAVLNTANDVTELVLAKRRNQEIQSLFQNLVMQAPVGMTILQGRNLIVEVANEFYLQIVGRSSEMLVGKPLWEVVPEAKDQGFNEMLLSVLDTGVPFSLKEGQAEIMRDGTMQTIYIDLLYYPMKEQDGKIDRIVCVVLEVTDQVLARQALERNEAELLKTKQHLESELDAGKQVQKQKDDFIGVASHELKTPLTSLKSSVQLLKGIIAKDPTSAKIQTLLNISDVSIQKLINLLEDLLNDTKINEGQLSLNKTKFMLSELVDDCCNHVRSAGIYKIIATGDLELKVLADEHRLGQVLVNLVNNAVKYAPGSTEINIRINKLQNAAKVSVTDTGPGIPSEKLIHLFKRYYRVDTLGIQYSGLGLGLFISSEIIKRHGGEIGVDSELGKGSTFWFTIPF